MAQYAKLRMRTRGSRGFSPSSACALAKSSVRATAVGSSGQSVKPAVTRATIYPPFLYISHIKLRDTAPNFSVGTEPPGRDRDGERGLGHGSARTW